MLGLSRRRPGRMDVAEILLLLFLFLLLLLLLLLLFISMTMFIIIIIISVVTIIIIIIIPTASFMQQRRGCTRITAEISYRSGLQHILFDLLIGG